MKTIAAIMAFGLVLTGCASNENKGPWRASVTMDRFTDEIDCFVSVSEYWGGDFLYTRQNHFYPYIQQENGELRVGLRSGGKFPIPVGNVKLRIDKNPAWEILVSESPSDTSQVTSLMPADYVKNITENLDEKNKALIEKTFSAQQKLTSQMLSTYTAATGEKAKSILEEMLAGKMLITQTAGMPGVKSTVGEAILNESLKMALADCKIEI